MTIWTFVEALVGAGVDGGAPAIQQLLDEPLAVRKENRATIFYAGNPPILSGSHEITDMDVVLSRQQGLTAAKLNLSGPCVTVTDIKQHYSDTYVADRPRSPAPGAVTVWATRELRVPVLFGFQNANPECLSSIIVDFERHIDTYDLRTDKRGT